MAKFFGKVGYGIETEIRPGVTIHDYTEREYSGDVIRNFRRYEPSDKVNDDLNINNTISILADPFAYQNFHSILYVEFMNALWKVTSVEVQFPRLLLTIGGVYNDRTGEEA